MRYVKQKTTHSFNTCPALEYNFPLMICAVWAPVEVEQVASWLSSCTRNQIPVPEEKLRRISSSTFLIQSRIETESRSKSVKGYKLFVAVPLHLLKQFCLKSDPSHIT
jgi:hypothetical protein